MLKTSESVEKSAEEREWWDGVIMVPHDANGVPLLLGDHVRAASTTGHGVVRCISYCVDDDGSRHTFVEVHGPSGTAFYAPSDLEHVPASPSARIREWVRRARADEHMDLRELDAIADELDAEVAE